MVVPAIRFLDSNQVIAKGNTKMAVHKE